RLSQPAARTDTGHQVGGDLHLDFRLQQRRADIGECVVHLLRVELASLSELREDAIQALGQRVEHSGWPVAMLGPLEPLVYRPEGSGMASVRSDDDARLLEQRLVVLRWIVAAFGAVQVGFAIRDRASDPTFVLPLGVALVVGLTLGNVAIAGAARKAED